MTKFRIKPLLKTGPPQKKELKKNVPPPEHLVSTQDTNFSSLPPIPAKTRHERKNKSSNVPGPAHGPIFFSDNEDIESDTRTQRDSRIPSVDEEDFHSFVRCISHTTKQKGIEVESDSEGEEMQKIVRIRKIWRMMMMKGKTMKIIVGRGTSRRRT